MLLGIGHHCCHLHVLLQQNLEWFDNMVPAYVGFPGNWPLKQMLSSCCSFKVQFRSLILLLLLW